MTIETDEGFIRVSSIPISIAISIIGLIMCIGTYILHYNTSIYLDIFLIITGSVCVIMLLIYMKCS